MPNWNEPIIHPITGQSNPAYLHGAITPMFTPCNEDRSLDETGIRSYVDYLIASRSVTALFVRSGLGQMYEFSIEDVKRLTDIVTDQASGRIPVMVGCNGIFKREGERPNEDEYVRQGIDLCHYARTKGAVAAVLTLPMALTAGRREELAEGTALGYFARITREVDIPVVVYQPPDMARRFRASPSFITGLAEMRTVVGMKISTSNMAVFVEAARAAQQNNFAMIAGDETVFLFTLLLGGTGVIGQGCTTHPEILRAIYECVMSQDMPGASRAALDNLEATRSAHGESLVSLVFGYLARKGVRVQPYSMNGGAPEREEVLSQFQSTIDAIRAPYLDSITR